MEFELTIHERSTYWQIGTVTVEADSLEEAIKKVEQGNEGMDYEHHGNNEILYNTEELLERKVIL